MTSERTSKWQDEIDPRHSADCTKSCSQDSRLEEVQSAVHEDAQDSPGKVLIQSVTEILTQSAQSVKAFVSGNAIPTASDGSAEETTGEEKTGDERSGEEKSGEEKTLLQSVGEKILQSAQSVKEVVSGRSDSSNSSNSDAVGSAEETIREEKTGEEETGEEKTLLQSVGERLLQSAQTVREVVSGRSDSSDSSDSDAVGNEEEKTFVQSVQERFSQTTLSVKEAVTGGISESDDGEEKSVLQAVGEKIVQSAKTMKDAVKGDVHIIPGDDETAEVSIFVLD